MSEHDPHEMHVIWEDENMRYSLNLSPDAAVCVHIDLHELTHNQYKKYLDVINECDKAFLEQGVDTLFAMVYTDHTPGNKLAQMFGYTLLGDLEERNVTLYMRKLGE